MPLPKPTWTWNDYLDAARKLTKKDANGTVIQAGFLPSGFGANDVSSFPWLCDSGITSLHVR